MTGGPTAAVHAFPPDALVLLVGPSGSGKSTWAVRHFDPHEVLSSDAFRAMVGGDAADQTATADAFKILHLVARARLRRGLRCVIDATNLTTGARRSSLRSAAAATRPTAAIVFDLSLERCLRQNAGRAGRQVPDDVVRKHHAQLQAALELVPKEGFTDVLVLRDADIGMS